MPIITEDELLNKTEITSGEDNFDIESKKIQNQELTEAEKQRIVIEGPLSSRPFLEERNIIGSTIATAKYAPSLLKSVAFAEPGDVEKLRTYNPLDDIPERHKNRASDFATATDPAQVQRIASLLDHRTENKRLIQDQGMLGLYNELLAQTVDPTVIIPAFHIVKSASLAKRVASALLTGGPLMALGVTTQESILRSQKATDTLPDVQTDLLVGGILGTITAGIAGFLSKTVAKAALAQIKLNLTEAPVIHMGIGPNGKPTARHASAAETDAFIKHQEGIAHLNTTLVKAITGPAQITRPVVIEGLLSDFPVVKQLTNQLFEHNLILEKNLAGVATDQPLTAIMKQEKEKMFQLNKMADQLYIDYSKIQSGPFKRSRANFAGRGSDRLSRNQFMEEAGRAARREDIHSNPHVEALAKTIRKDVFERITKELQAAGILGEKLEVKTAASYLTRIFNIEMILKNRAKFEKIVINYLEQEATKGDKRLIGLDPVEIKQKARDITNNIVNRGEGKSSVQEIADRYATKGTPTFTRERVWLIQDENIEEFLVNNIMDIANEYALRSRNILGIKTVLDRMGVENLTALRTKLASQIEKEMTLTKGDLTKLSKKGEEATKLMNDMLDIVTGNAGQKGVVDDMLGALRTYNTVTMLGGVLISSVSDVGQAITLAGGMGKFMRTGLNPVLRGFGDNWRAFDKSTKVFHHFGLAFDIEQSGVLKALNSSDYQIGATRTKLQSAMDTSLKGFGKITLLAYWDGTRRRVMAQVAAATAIDVMSKSKISTKDISKLARHGIGKDMIPRIMKMQKKFGEKVNGSYITAPDIWTDKEAAQAFGSYVQRSVDNFSMLPGPGDYPRVYHKSAAAKSIFQFKAFTLAATQKITLSGLQARDAAALQGWIVSIGLGGMSFQMKELLAGREPTEDVDVFVKEGIIRSGVLGLMADYASAFSPFSETRTARYASQNALGAILGPTTGSVGNIFKLITGAADGDMSQSDRNSAKRMIPYHNLFYLRKQIDEAFKE